jgi:hypothetical protein
MKRSWLVNAAAAAASNIAFFAGLVRPLLRGNARENRRVRSEADRIVEAVRAHRRDHGVYPDSLQQLVPRYLPRLPHAKYTGPMGFTYVVSSDRHVLGWTDVPPFGRPFYVFEEDRWGYLD